jgi:hypothetical protein
MGAPPSETPASDQVIFETHKTIGDEAGESLEAINFNGGLLPPFSSRSYLNLDQHLRDFVTPS